MRAIPIKLIPHRSNCLISFFVQKIEARIAVTIGVTETIKLADPAFTVFHHSLMLCDKK